MSCMLQIAVAETHCPWMEVKIKKIRYGPAFVLWVKRMSTSPLPDWLMTVTGSGGR